MISWRWILSLFVGLALAASLAAHRLELFERPLVEQALLVGVTAIGLGVLIYRVFPYLALRYESARWRNILVAQAALAAALVALRSPYPPLARLVDFVAVFGLAFASLLPLGSGTEHAIRTDRQGTLLLAWLTCLPPAFFGAGYLSNLYPEGSFMPIAIVTLTVLGTLAHFVIQAARRPRDWRAAAVGAAGVCLSLGFASSIIWLCLQYPNLFDPATFLPRASDAALFWPLALLAPASIAFAVRAFDEGGRLAHWRESQAAARAREHLPGILLAACFTLAYAALAHVFNRPGQDLTENFFAADNFAWIGRLSAPGGAQIEMRAVHPFAFFVFRPVVWLLSLLLNGDRTAAALLLVPLAGGACVLLTWLFVLRLSGSRAYALLTASLLGASTTHLVFGSIVETYIFSAAALLLFFVLLLDEKTPLAALVAVGALTFGITITNFVQTFIGFVAARPRLRAIFTYGLLASALSITLSVLHAAAYPSALLFFVPAHAGVEEEYAIAILGQPAWRLAGRLVLLARNLLLYNVLAPEPFALTEEVGGYFPRFNFFRLTPGTFNYSGYDGLAQAVALIWLLLLAGAALAFLWQWARTRRAGLGAAFLGCMLFNLALHMGYGYEPFLYSANWTYALVLFTATALAKFAEQRWLQITLLIFLALLMVNQWGFLKFILQTVSPFFS